MASILEFNMAEIFASSINPQGGSSHVCTNYHPVGLGEYEGQDIKRYDPEAYTRLLAHGVTEHRVESEDFELVSQVIENNLSSLEPHIRNNANTHFYKHAIALRLGREVLIADNHRETQACVDISATFGNNFRVI